MIKGKSIVELAQELQACSEQKQDFVADTRDIELSTDASTLNIGTSNLMTAHDHKLSDLAHAQIAQRTNIPKRYYDLMRTDAPDLLANNVNRWFQDKPKRRMVRTLAGDARAFLSDQYRRVDNEEIAQAVLPALLDSNAGFEVLSSQVTESRMYIQARLPRIEGEVKVGDAVQAGLIITNSEVGLGAIDIKPMIYRLICTNGMVSGSDIADGRMRKTHLGAKVQAGNDHIVFSDETQAARDQALMLEIRDTIHQLSDPQQFFRLMDKMRAATEGPQVRNPVQAVEALSKAFTLPQNESDNILEQLIKAQDYSRWGMLNAVTVLANDNASYDRAVELETLGGSILNMPGNSWQKIAEAA